MNPPFFTPDPSDNPLAAAIAIEVAANGPMRLDRYMTRVSSGDAWAYYRTRAAVGAGGDFITAPEISQIFGELVGAWCADRWQAMGGPDPFNLVEPGPGRGVLMADALRTIGAVSPACASAARLHLVERSAPLMAMQRTRLADHRPAWHDTLAEVPAGPCIVVANEFVDALPIRQFRAGAEGWQERAVGAGAGDALTLVWTPAEAASMPALPVRGTPETGTVVEVAPMRAAIAADIARRVSAEGGVGLIVDYGYRASGPGDSLQAVRGHQPARVTDDPGRADVTAHVDFGALARAAAEAGARVDGPVDQGRWLLNLGAAARLEALVRANPGQERALRTGLERLIDPEEMGHLFQVMAISAPDLSAAPGFN